MIYGIRGSKLGRSSTKSSTLCLEIHGCLQSSWTFTTRSKLSCRFLTRARAARAHSGHFAVNLGHRNSVGAAGHRVAANGGNGPRERARAGSTGTTLGVGLHVCSPCTVVIVGRPRPSFLICGYGREKFAHPGVNCEFPNRPIVADDLLYVSDHPRPLVFLVTKQRGHLAQ